MLKESAENTSPRFLPAENRISIASSLSSTRTGLRVSVLAQPHRILSIDPNQKAQFMHALLPILFHAPAEMDAVVSWSESAHEFSLILPESFCLNNPSFASDALSESYRVLQIDSDLSGTDDDLPGKKIYEICEPLAKSEISIFYLATYQTDFILVKQKRLRDVWNALKDFDIIWDGVDLSVDMEAVTPEKLLESESVNEGQTSAACPHWHRTRPSAEQTYRLVGIDLQHLSLLALTLIDILFYSNGNRFFSYTITASSLSLWCTKDQLCIFPDHFLHQNIMQRGWKSIEIDLKDVDVAVSGIVTSITKPFIDASIGLSYISTYHGACLMVREEDWNTAKSLYSFGDDSDQHL